MAALPSILDEVPLEVLPPPRTFGGASLVEVMRDRRSVRELARTPLTREELGQLLWAAQGITRPWGARTAPSAGATFPIEVYVVDREGVAWYRPRQHALERVCRDDRHTPLAAMAMGQESVGEAPTVLVLAAVVGRTAARYGARAVRYCAMEAGHVAQNVLLQAVALGLASVPVGAFDDDHVARVLDLPDGYEPLYLLPVGHAAGG